MKKKLRPLAKRAVASTKKKAARAMKKVAPAGGAFRTHKKPIGFHVATSGLLVPDSVAPKPVPATKLQAGLRTARKQIDDSLDELLRVVAGPYKISSIEIELSFSADGKFLGFGVGGATSMKLIIEPDGEE